MHHFNPQVRSIGAFSPFSLLGAVRVTRRLVTQRRGRTMARVSYQTLSRFTFLSDTFRTVRIVFRAVAFNDTGKKGMSKPKQRLYGSHHAGGSIT